MPDDIMTVEVEDGKYTFSYNYTQHSGLQCSRYGEPWPGWDRVDNEMKHSKVFFCLVYELYEARRAIARLKRDPDAKTARVQRHTKNLKQLFEWLENGSIFIEDLDPNILEKLRVVLAAQGK